MPLWHSVTGTVLFDIAYSMPSIYLGSLTSLPGRCCWGAKLFPKSRKVIIKSFQDRHFIWDCTSFFLSSLNLKNFPILNRKIAVRPFVLSLDTQKIQSYRGGDVGSKQTQTVLTGDIKLRGRSQPLSNRIWRKVSMLAGYSAAVTFRISCALFWNVRCEPGTEAGPRHRRTLSRAGRPGLCGRAGRPPAQGLSLSSLPRAMPSNPAVNPATGDPQLQPSLARTCNVRSSSAAQSPKSLAPGSSPQCPRHAGERCWVRQGSRWGLGLPAAGGSPGWAGLPGWSAPQARQRRCPSSLGWTRAAEDTSRIGTWALKANGSGIVTQREKTGYISGALGRPVWLPQLLGWPLVSHQGHDTPARSKHPSWAPSSAPSRTLLCVPSPPEACCKLHFKPLRDTWHHRALVKRPPSWALLHGHVLRRSSLPLWIQLLGSTHRRVNPSFLGYSRQCTAREPEVCSDLFNTSCMQ